MNGEGFAFSCWVRLNIAIRFWHPDAHGWDCTTCRYEWKALQRRAGLKKNPEVKIVLKRVTYARTSNV